MCIIFHLWLILGVCLWNEAATVSMHWSKEAQRWTMTGSQRRSRWRVFRPSRQVLLGLPASVTEPGWVRLDCCSYNDHVRLVLPLLTRNQLNPTSGCCGWKLRGPPRSSRLAGLRAQRSPGSGHLLELWRCLRRASIVRAFTKTVWCWLLLNQVTKFLSVSLCWELVVVSGWLEITFMMMMICFSSSAIIKASPPTEQQW